MVQVAREDHNDDDEACFRLRESALSSELGFYADQRVRLALGDGGRSLGVHGSLSRVRAYTVWADMWAPVCVWHPRVLLFGVWVLLLARAHTYMLRTYVRASCRMRDWCDM